MKKLILVLAILAVAAPAFGLSVDLVRDGTTKRVSINYSGADPCNLPRAFALVLDVSGGQADVNGIVAGSYKTGESTSTNRGYGIYPATIQIQADGSVTDWGTPIASGSDPLPTGADQTLPSNKLVLEFGSLYAPVHDGTNSPATSGTLCMFSIDCNNQTTDPVITMTGETTFRGGVVLEDGTTFAVNKSLTMTGACGVTDCVKSTAPFYTVWVGGGTMPWSKPTCWCYRRNCRGDADGLKALNLYWVYTQDLSLLKQAYAKQDSQMTGTRICADFARDKALNLYRVYTTDLAALKGYYAKPEAQVPVCDMTNYNFWSN